MLTDRPRVGRYNVGMSEVRHAAGASPQFPEYIHLLHAVWVEEFLTLNLKPLGIENRLNHLADGGIRLSTDGRDCDQSTCVIHGVGHSRLALFQESLLDYRMTVCSI